MHIKMENQEFHSVQTYSFHLQMKSKAQTADLEN